MNSGGKLPSPFRSVSFFANRFAERMAIRRPPTAAVRDGSLAMSISIGGMGDILRTGLDTIWARYGHGSVHRNQAGGQAVAPTIGLVSDTALLEQPLHGGVERGLAQPGRLRLFLLGKLCRCVGRAGAGVN